MTLEIQVLTWDRHIDKGGVKHVIGLVLMFENKYCLTSVSRWESVLDILLSKTSPLHYTGAQKFTVTTEIPSTTWTIFYLAAKRTHPYVNARCKSFKMYANYEGFL